MNTQSPLLAGDIQVPPARPSLLARLGRHLLLKQLAKFEHGELRVVEPTGEQHVFGRRTAEYDFGSRWAWSSERSIPRQCSQSAPPPLWPNSATSRSRGQRARSPIVSTPKRSSRAIVAGPTPQSRRTG